MMGNDPTITISFFSFWAGIPQLKRNQEKKHNSGEKK